MNEKKKRTLEKISRKPDFFLIGFVLFETVLFLLLFLIVFPSSMEFVLAAVGQDNVTVESLLTVGNSFPEIVNITINGGNAIDLIPNATTEVSIVAIVRDFNGEADIASVRSEFFDNSVSFYGDADDNNFHYTNASCVIDTNYGSGSEANATCIFDLAYYAHNATWNATFFVNDTLASSSIGSDVENVNALLALGLPDSIDYGEINATFVSEEQEANVTNFGNVVMNLSLSGYGATEGDGNAMNCTLGSTQNISIEFEKYNLTSSNPGALDLVDFEVNYTNLTSDVAINEFNLDYRRNDVSPFFDDTNTTYWRIYVPLGVAGSCSGNIIFGASQSAAS